MGNPNRFIIIAGKGTVSTTRRIFLLVISTKPPVTEAQEKIGLALIGEDGIGQVLTERREVPICSVAELGDERRSIVSGQSRHN